MRRTLTLAILLLSGTAFSAEIPEEIQTKTLENGLKIIVWPDHDIPNVAMYNFVRAGGRNEYPGITGLAHFFEHMMFNGTEKRAPGEFDRVMEAAGGSNNAYASPDVTVYQNWFPRSALEVIFELESDRLENLTSERGIIESERGVVYSERRTRVDNNNFRKLFEQVKATHYVAHPYQFPVLGWPSDIENWKQEDLENFYKTYYAPNNQTMVFSGDVRAEEIFELADKYLAGIPAQEPPPEITTVEPEQQGTRRVSVEVPAQTPLLHMAFHAGSARDPITDKMDMLLTILTGGDSSRMHRTLVEEEGLAISVGGYQSAGFDPGHVYFYLTLPPGADVKVVENRVFEILMDISENGVKEVELKKARRIALSEFWNDLSTINGKASAIGTYEVYGGDWKKLFTKPEVMGKTTQEDLQEAAKTIFKKTNMTVGVLQSPEDAS